MYVLNLGVKELNFYSELIITSLLQQADHNLMLL